jgi:zinc transport system substrate-binding protein
VKRIFIALTALIFVFAGACGRPADAQTTTVADSGKLNIVATIFPPTDFARQVAGDKANVTMLLPPAAESHSFEPTPQDILKIQNCDLFIYVGGESDEWVRGILESIESDKMKVLTLMDCVEVVEEIVVEGMQDEEEHDHDEGEEEIAEEPEYDEHVWTSPRNAKRIVEKISAALVEIDAANAEFYQSNTRAYQEKLDTLNAAFQAVTDAATRKTIVFGDRFPFRYFADAYGLDYFAAFPGCSVETEASAQTMKFLIDKVNAEKIPVVFRIELSNGKIADTIAEATGAKVLELHACHNISRDDFAAGKTYIEIMTANVDALKEALA